MLKQTIKNLHDSTLWRLLADISEIMGSDRHKDHEETAAFWLSVANDLKTEIDTRLFDDYDNDRAIDDFDDDLDNEDD